MEHYHLIQKPSFSVVEGDNKRLIANHDPMPGNYTSMKAAIGLAPDNIENRSIEEPASRNEFCHDHRQPGTPPAGLSRVNGDRRSSAKT